MAKAVDSATTENNVEIADLQAKLKYATEALQAISDEMKFPNQLESGFVHRKPTLADMQSRVGLARSISAMALNYIKGNNSD